MAAREDIRRRFLLDPVQVHPEVELSGLADGLVAASLAPDGLVPPGCSVFAAGGYGRGTLHPGSDLDFLILFAESADEAGVGRILDAVGETGFEIGHQVKTLESFDRFDPEEVDGYLAFFHVRRLGGERRLAEEFSRVVFPVFLRRNASACLAAMIGAREQRISGTRTDSSEPDIKLDTGGLRDYQFACQVSRVLGVPPPDVSPAVGLLRRIRNAVHYVSEGAGNVLGKAFHRRVARLLGYGSDVAALLEACRASRASICRLAREAETAARAVARRDANDLPGCDSGGERPLDAC